MKLGKLKFSLKNRRALLGYAFTAPFTLGFILFFLYPIIQSIIFSLSELHITTLGFELDFVGLKNYHYALFVDPNFVRTFVESVGEILLNIPAIMIFSFFVATLLNQDFRGRILARIVFFLPVILTAGIVQRMEQGDFATQILSGTAVDEVETAAAGFLGARVEVFLMQMRLPEGFVEYIIALVDQLPQIINASAIPILIFLAGLQSIPKSLYEASNIEGASAWENFWKITFPLLTPLLVTNLVYIIIDSFTSVHNELVQLIQDTAWGGAGYGVSTAMAWFYFVAIAIILAVAIGISSRGVVYMD